MKTNSKHIVCVALFETFNLLNDYGMPRTGNNLKSKKQQIIITPKCETLESKEEEQQQKKQNVTLSTVSQFIWMFCMLIFLFCL